jgi:hypothetical protein
VGCCAPADADEIQTYERPSTAASNMELNVWRHARVSLVT